MDALSKWSTVFVTIEMVVCLLGIFFNALVIFTICKNTYRLSPSTFLILSIAVSDFLSSSVAVPFSIARHLLKEWPFGMAGCQAHAFMIFLLALVSLTHLAAISAGKYLTITKSLSRQSYFNMKLVMRVIVISWILSFGVSVAPLIGWSRIYVLEGIRETCSEEHEPSLPGYKAYFGIVFFACYVMALVVITFCYFKIHVLSKSIVCNTSQMGGLPAVMTTQALLRKHHKSAMYFLTIIAAFMLSWSPYATASFLTVLRVKLNPVATTACSMFAKTSFFLNPILYALVSRKFRRRMTIAVPLTRRNRAIRPALLPSSRGPLAL